MLRETPIVDSETSCSRSWFDGKREMMWSFGVKVEVLTFG